MSPEIAKPEFQITARSWLGPYAGIALAWGGSFMFIKLALSAFTPFGVVFLSSTTGSILMLLVARIKHVALPRGWRVWLKLWFMALSISAAPGVLTAVAESHASSSFVGIVLSGLIPLMSLFFIVIVFRDEPISSAQVIGLVVGLIGVLVIFAIWQGVGHNLWWAVIAVIAAAGCVGFSYPFSRRYLVSLDIDPIALSCAQLILTTITLLPAFLLDGRSSSAIPVKAIFGVLCLGIFANGLAFMWNFQVVRAVGSSVASTVNFLSPAVALLCGIILLHEHLTWYEPVGGCIILLGVAISQGRLTLPIKRRSAT